ADANASQAMLVEHILNGDRVGGGHERFLVDVGEWCAEELKRFGDTLRLSRQRLKLDVLYLGQFFGPNAANRDDEQGQTQAETVRHHGRILREKTARVERETVGHGSRKRAGNQGACI